MRNTPYTFAQTPQPPVTPVKEVTEPAKTTTGFVDLFSRVKKTESVSNDQPPVENNTGTPAAEPTTTNQQPTTGSATFEDGFEQFKETTGKKVSDFVENTEDFAKIIVRFGNAGRSILLPQLYERAMFTQPEKDALKGILEKSYANEKQNKPADTDFNFFEKRVYDKWKKLETAKASISYTEEEVIWLAKIVAKRIKDMSVAVWLEKYDWVIAILYLEFKHAQTILAIKAEEFVINRFTGKAAA